VRDENSVVRHVPYDPPVHIGVQAGDRMLAMDNIIGNCVTHLVYDRVSLFNCQWATFMCGYVPNRFNVDKRPSSAWCRQR
jgi:hypothetical protein